MITFKMRGLTGALLTALVLTALPGGAQEDTGATAAVTIEEAAPAEAGESTVVGRSSRSGRIVRA